MDGKVERVKPGDIKTTAVMTVEGELDDISGSGQTRAALDMCSSVPAGQKTHFEVKGAGHYGIFSGRRWRELVYPEIKAFILAHNQAPAQVKRAQPAIKKVAKPATRATVKPTVKPVASAPAKTAVRPAGKRAAAKTASSS